MKKLVSIFVSLVFGLQSAWAAAPQCVTVADEAVANHPNISQNAGLLTPDLIHRVYAMQKNIERRTNIDLKAQRSGDQLTVFELKWLPEKLDLLTKILNGESSEIILRYTSSLAHRTLNARLMVDVLTLEIGDLQAKPTLTSAEKKSLAEKTKELKSYRKFFAKNYRKYRRVQRVFNAIRLIDPATPDFQNPEVRSDLDVGDYATNVESAKSVLGAEVVEKLLAKPYLIQKALEANATFDLTAEYGKDLAGPELDLLKDYFSMNSLNKFYNTKEIQDLQLTLADRNQAWRIASIAGSTVMRGLITGLAKIIPPRSPLGKVVHLATAADEGIIQQDQHLLAVELVRKSDGDMDTLINNLFSKAAIDPAIPKKRFMEKYAIFTSAGPIIKLKVRVIEKGLIPGRTKILHESEAEIDPASKEYERYKAAVDNYLATPEGAAKNKDGEEFTVLKLPNKEKAIRVSQDPFHASEFLIYFARLGHTGKLFDKIRNHLNKETSKDSDVEVETNAHSPDRIMALEQAYTMKRALGEITVVEGRAYSVRRAATAMVATLAIVAGGYFGLKPVGQDGQPMNVPVAAEQIGNAKAAAANISKNSPIQITPEQAAKAAEALTIVDQLQDQEWQDNLPNK